MISVHCYSDSVHVPVWVSDLKSFRRWIHSDESPEKAPVFFLAGEVWVDMSKEQIFSHVRLKQEFFRILGTVAKEGRLGDFLPDGLLLTNEEADLSGNPDGTFVSKESFRNERVRLIEGAEDGYVELEGSPDMVLEVVSDSSVEKDTEVLRELYWKAGIREYWLVDARGERLDFQILRHTTRGYAPIRKSAGWLKSAVFAKSFRLTRQLDDLGHPDFTLDVR
jgi:Uma2 family endonuclease